MRKVLSTALFGAMVLSCGIQTTEPIQREYIPTYPQVETKEVRAPKIRARPLKVTEETIEKATRVREFTQSDAELLMRVAEAEAGNQGREGMELIFAVILNRVNSDRFPDSIYEVVHQTSQFTTVTKGTYLKVELSPEVHLALAEIEKGIPLDEEIIGFETTANGKTLEEYFQYAYTVGDHDFFIEKRE